MWEEDLTSWVTSHRRHDVLKASGILIVNILAVNVQTQQKCVKRSQVKGNSKQMQNKPGLLL